MDPFTLIMVGALAIFVLVVVLINYVSKNKVKFKIHRFDKDTWNFEPGSPLAAQGIALFFCDGFAKEATKRDERFLTEYGAGKQFSFEGQHYTVVDLEKIFSTNFGMGKTRGNGVVFYGTGLKGQGTESIKGGNLLRSGYVIFAQNA